MRAFPYDPWALLDQFRHEVNRNAQERGTQPRGALASSDWTPAVDILERDDGFVLLVDVPGVDPQDIDIDMDKGVLSIHGRRSAAAGEGRAYQRAERPRGAFHRRFSMPDTADAHKITARSRNGVLEITIPKLEKVQPRKITVEQ